MLSLLRTQVPVDGIEDYKESGIEKREREEAQWAWSKVRGGPRTLLTFHYDFTKLVQYSISSDRLPRRVGVHAL